MVLITVPAAAFTYGTGPYGVCLYGSCQEIAIISNGSVSLNVDPTAAGACTIQSDTVSVFTQDSSGIILTLNNSSTSTSLSNGSSTINSTTATQASPAALAVNSWGYRVDGVGEFGAGPTTAQSDTTLNSILFAEVPPSNGTPDILASTNIAADPPVNTNVWYSDCANTSVGSGIYSAQVTYTAIAN
jgi:hypothetical protein